MTDPAPNRPLRLALPKGRMQHNLLQLLADAGMPVRLGQRDYRPRVANTDFDCKLLKPQNVVEMLHQGSRDLGFAGADWVRELGFPLVELLDTGLDPVRIVAAAPAAFLESGALPRRRFVVASEYEVLTRDWLRRCGHEAAFVRSYGATEAFPPDDADVIVDNTATGDTLAANGLSIVDELLRSSTRLYANPRSLDDPARRRRVDEFVQLLRSVLDARLRAMLDVNVDAAHLTAVIEALPAMQNPTVSPLHGGSGYAVRAAVPRRELPSLLLRLRELGARDLVVSTVSQLLP
ncbi:MAG: ATP phosphoribosyltransferase [Planctomycetes bacterium]|nr:ATP phosphoribosyltransferase [Planctomycetota bacterium]